MAISSRGLTHSEDRQRMAYASSKSLPVLRCCASPASAHYTICTAFGVVYSRSMCAPDATTRRCFPSLDEVVQRIALFIIAAFH